MVSVYGNWKRLVRATLQRDQLCTGKQGHERTSSGLAGAVSALSNIDAILQAADEIQAEDPNVARILCDQAYSMSLDLNPSSDGRGVLLLKTGLMALTTQKIVKRDRTKIDRNRDIERLWEFYQLYKRLHKVDDMQQEFGTSNANLGELEEISLETKRIFATMKALIDVIEAHIKDAPDGVGEKIVEEVHYCFIFALVLTLTSKWATNNFRDRVGRGGSGFVFKGVLKDGSTVAVKKVDLTENGKQFFEAEISTIASVRHIHLIRLRGYCSHMMKSGGGFYVVYDLLPNGSLDTWIFPRIGGPTGRFLSWQLRYQVAVGVARALIYLHHDCFPPILHLDIKPANILLDGQLRAVLCDFGHSKLTNEDESDVRSKHIRGTTGYIAPEILQGGRISGKCDMYSYGKVLLDLFFGQLHVCLDQNGNDIYVKDGNSPLEQRTFHAFIRKKLQQKSLVNHIDKRLMNGGRVDEKEVSSLVRAALLCLEEDPNNRPTDMRKVLNILEAGKPDGIGAMVDKLAEGTVPSANGGLLVIRLHEAQNIEVPDNTKSLFARVRFKGEYEDETSAVKKSRNPKWKEKFLLWLNEAPCRDDELVVDVLSQRYTPLSIGIKESYKRVGLVKINLSDVVENKKTNEMYPLSESGEENIHIELEWQPGAWPVAR
ncbi:hypothetical protein GIB67_026813 [Kingdonia uniflora]|uniref:Uncharacterized protein n=1 Tax=Kingdonia uniflora TaxID=39325 RepID=A0A7J7MHL2_9MAGN|nr:hypothetical protein GIB67_026813 [Kingdonia uniflora]